MSDQRVGPGIDRRSALAAVAAARYRSPMADAPFARFAGVDLAEIAGSRDTPFYAHDLDGMRQAAEELVASFGVAERLVAYAVKANSSASVLRALFGAGTGADVVSGPELELALRCGAEPSDVVFSGVAKTDAEIDRAIAARIASIHVESIEEIARVAARAKALGAQAPVSVRVNPSLAKEAIATHAHVATGHDEAKFGVLADDMPHAFAALEAARDHVRAVGVSAHVGSQLTEVEPYVASASALIAIAQEFRRRFSSTMRLVDTGGGMGIDYGAGCPVRPGDFVRAVRPLLERAGLADLRHVIEPGRCLVAPYVALVSRVVQTKASPSRPELRWLLVDAGMNDLLRPALYQANHRVSVVAGGAGPEVPWRVVGPVCESSDDFGLHALPEQAPALVCFRDAGAYGYTMASRYNGRALPGEVFLAGGQVVHEVPRASAAAWVDDRMRA
jgi:diaminopimelate decarboxylase